MVAASPKPESAKDMNGVAFGRLLDRQAPVTCPDNMPSSGQELAFGGLELEIEARNEALGESWEARF